MVLRSYPFSKEGKEALEKSEKKAKDWPVLYLINGEKELYIGETQNAVNRMGQHLENAERKSLTRFNVIFDDEYNKSAILDLEQQLIQLCGADHKFTLQNLNGGQSYKHDYYEREKYLNKIDSIWEALKDQHLVAKTLEDIRNSDLFKYSPYNTLTVEQGEISNEIIIDALKKLSEGKEGASIIYGGAGTGKTIVLINILYRLLNASKSRISSSEEQEELSDYMHVVMAIQNYIKEHEGKKLKIAYICPMTSLRATMKKVFKASKNGLDPSIIKGPQGLFDGGEKYDIVLVDEAHRLCQRKNLTSYGSFDKIAKKIGMDPSEATQLDMILARSKYRILVYDPEQTVKGSDISPEQFRRALEASSPLECRLSTQMRCKGGERFTDYLDSIFRCSQKEPLYFDPDEYDFRMFYDIGEMEKAIKRNDKVFGLCRMAAGYSWKWVSKPYIDKGYQYIKEHHLEDIHIDGYDLVWNMTNEEFIISKGAVDQVGCIHTLQGYDLNYVGLIFGKEIDYDSATNKIVINKDEFYDTKVKSGVDEETLARYIVNSYKVMMTRGIKGCYVYVCNPRLREYLSRFIKE